MYAKSITNICEGLLYVRDACNALKQSLYPVQGWAGRINARILRLKAACDIIPTKGKKLLLPI